jgi:hypothetical protein
MNDPHEHNHEHAHGHDRNQDAPLPDALRWQLRDLRGERMPTRDLWPGIAARLPAARAPRRWLPPAALAASLLLVAGAIGWQTLQPGTSQSVASPIADIATSDTLVQREARGMTLQYEAAFREMATLPDDPALRPAFDELDRSTTQILDALSDQPDSRLLLEQLRRTYARRLALSQRQLHT